MFLLKRVTDTDSLTFQLQTVETTDSLTQNNLMNFLHAYVNYHLKVKTKHFLLLEFTHFRAFYALGLILT